MEEERYVIRYDLDYNECLIDTEDKKGVGDIFKVVNLLNQQDKRIKELEETNKLLSNELTKNSILKQDHIETCCGIPIFEIPKIKEENQQLKQQLEEKEKEQNQKAIEQLEKVKEKFGYKHNSQLVISSKNLVGFIDQQINELKGEVKDVKD